MPVTLEKVFFTLSAFLLTYYFLITLGMDDVTPRHKSMTFIFFVISLALAWIFHVKKPLKKR